MTDESRLITDEITVRFGAAATRMIFDRNGRKAVLLRSLGHDEAIAELGGQ